MISIGLDPGASGGLAIISGVRIPSVVLLPFSSGIDPEVADGLKSLETAGETILATIEKVGAMPRQGVSSTFKFGTSYGYLIGCLTAVGIPFEYSTPQKWQKAFGIPKRAESETKSQFKNRLKTKAQQLYPNYRKEITLQTADALLIAEYTRRKQLGIQ